LLLAILLGADAAFVVMASVLVVQALFFADGGLLALGANLFNLGVVPCYIAYGLVYRPLAGRERTPGRTGLAAVAAALVALQAGAAGVALQTAVSGISSLSLTTFAALLLPIHAAIGIVEGLVTAALLLFLLRSRPDLLPSAPAGGPAGYRPLLRKLALATVLTGGVLSWFASTQPDGLAWALAHAARPTQTAAPPGEVHLALAAVQQRSAWLAGYEAPAAAAPAEPSRAGLPPRWPEVEGSTSMAGLVGGVITIAVVAAVGLALRRRKPRD
jgi:cobalt/nickel transport system permease protein